VRSFLLNYDRGRLHELISLASNVPNASDTSSARHSAITCYASRSNYRAPKWKAIGAWASHVPPAEGRTVASNSDGVFKSSRALAPIPKICRARAWPSCGPSICRDRAEDTGGLLHSSCVEVKHIGRPGLGASIAKPKAPKTGDRQIRPATLQ
jgi:hypothetical protein